MRRGLLYSVMTELEIVKNWTDIIMNSSYWARGSTPRH